MTKSEKDEFINVSSNLSSMSLDTPIYTTTADYTVSDIMESNDYTFTIDSTDNTINIDNLSWDFGNKIDPEKVERMTKEYPALEKAWANFKNIYDMCVQDYDGKIKSGELDDDIPF